MRCPGNGEVSGRELLRLCLVKQGLGAELEIQMGSNDRGIPMELKGAGLDQKRNLQALQHRATNRYCWMDIPVHGEKNHLDPCHP